MSCGVTRILSRIRWYFRYSLKNKKQAGCFCLTCKWYDQCRWEVEYVETIFGEPFEVED